MKYFAVVVFESVMRLLFALPRFRLANALKSGFLRLCGASIGRRVVFYPGVWICTGRNLRVGDHVDFALDVLVTSDGGVRIGDRTLIGYRSQILSSNHAIPAGAAASSGPAMSASRWRSARTYGSARTA